MLVILRLHLRENKEKTPPTVLGLAEMKLIFRIAALIVLGFVLVARKLLTDTHQCFGYS